MLVHISSALRLASRIEQTGLPYLKSKLDSFQLRASISAARETPNSGLMKFQIVRFVYRSFASKVVPSLLASAEGLHFVYLLLYSTQWVPWPSIGYHCMGAGVNRASLSQPTSGGKSLLAYGDSILQVSAPKKRD